MKRWISRLAVFALVMSLLTTGASALSCREVCSELVRGLPAGGCQGKIWELLTKGSCSSIFRLICFGQLPEVPLPEEDAAAPEEDVAAPEEDVAAPEEDVAAPEEDLEAPEEDAEAPKEDAEAPEEDAEAPKEDAAAPEEDVPASHEDQTAGGVLSAYEAEVIRLVNEIRRQNGLGELTASAELSHVARLKSQDMHDKGYFDHTSPTYGSAFDMLRSFGISYGTAGENIAYGYSTPQAVVDAWMNSSGHRANILNASYTQIGVGHVQDGNYCTQIFVG